MTKGDDDELMYFAHACNFKIVHALMLFMLKGFFVPDEWPRLEKSVLFIPFQLRTFYEMIADIYEK